MITYLNSEEIAKHLRITTRTLFSLRKRRIIPYMRVGRGIRYNMDEVDKAMEKRMVKAL